MKPYTHFVIICREGETEVRGFHDYTEAMAWADEAGLQWSEVYVTEVLKGPLV